MAGATARKNRALAVSDLPVQRRGAEQIVDANLLAPSGAKRVALIGVTGAAQAHAAILKALKDVRLEGIIDPDLERARSFAARQGSITAAASLRDMLAAQPLDAVHILATVEQRADVVQDALSLGLSVLAESPLAWDVASAEALVRAAAGSPADALAVNHHFLFHPAFKQLADAVARRELGPLLSLSATVALPSQASAATQKPNPADLLLAEAVHPLSQILSLTGPVTHWKVLGAPRDGMSADIPLAIALAGDACDAQLHLRFGATYPVWQLTAFCTDGVLKADMLRNRFVREARSKNSGSVDNFLEARRLGYQLLGEARRELLAHSRALMGYRKDAVRQSLSDAIAAFYRHDLPAVSLPEGAAQIVQLCEDIAAEAFPAPPTRSHAPVASAFRADAVVLGGTGFLGRHIAQALAQRGLKVAALSRSRTACQEDDQIRFFQGDIRDGNGLVRLAEGANILVNATAPEALCPRADCERRSQAMIANLIAACRQGGVKRLVHLSSLDALYTGDRYDVITGRASPDPYDWQRDSQARAKGLEEIALLTAYEEGLLPLSILRPGIVVGEGGTPYPHGVGQFVNFRHCLGWNRGLNPLPFVLAEDVAAAVVACAERDGALGHCFNLVGDVRLSARDYVAALGQVLQRPFQFHPRSPDWLYLSERLKTGLRRKYGAGPFCSRRELASRGMAASFDCADAKAALAWTPIADRETFIARGLMVHAPAVHASGAGARAS
jgi:predicted dehydrogenase/nucleoside-diphosphate-sugar epimerase